MYSDYGFDPSAEHYACVVDLLGHRGYLVEALRLLKNMKLPGTASIWGALLSGCMMHRNVEIGEVAAHHLFQLEPKNTSNYIALCSIYESRGIFDGVSRVRARMRDLGLVKTPGCSWIHIAGRVHKFYKGNISHPRTQMIYRLLCRIIKAQMLTNDIEMSEAQTETSFSSCRSPFHDSVGASCLLPRQSSRGIYYVQSSHWCRSPPSALIPLEDCYLFGGTDSVQSS
ncbi:Pentatricopeptide repeat [Quillaja saponaria]|uniref:Pentatricopeptide repeat n=1 Tax=Quillaja saponaria TaxID=32244 RepID=A0AAD7KSJ7_QUISA|nr:Pentatricopeptide repeat [Quillaja saponaria]